MKIKQPASKKTNGLAWLRSFSSTWEEKFKKGQQTVDFQCLYKAEPYVPLDTGRTISSGYEQTDFGSGVVRYLSRDIKTGEFYTRDIYYVNASGYILQNFRGHPLRGSLWFEKMKAAHKEEIRKLAMKAIRKGNFII